MENITNNLTDKVITVTSEDKLVVIDTDDYLQPNIGDTVYIVLPSSITRVPTLLTTTVGFVGKDSFIVNKYKQYNINHIEFRYDEYNDIWFTSNEKANAKLKYKKSHKDDELVIHLIYDNIDL